MELMLTRSAEKRTPPPRNPTGTLIGGLIRFDRLPATDVISWRSQPDLSPTSAKTENGLLVPRMGVWISGPDPERLHRGFMNTWASWTQSQKAETHTRLFTISPMSGTITDDLRSLLS